MGDAENPVDNKAQRAAGDIVAKDAEGKKGRPGKGELAGGSRRNAWSAGAALATVVAIGGGVVIANAGGKSSPDSISAGRSAVASTTAGATTTLPALTTTTSASTTTTTMPVLVSGRYNGTVRVESDPAGHSCCVKPASGWDVLQQRNTTTGGITIALSNVLEGVQQLTSPLESTGARFTAVGEGTVAGRPGTSVAFDGTVDPEHGLHGSLTVGANGTLPTGRPIIFAVDMGKA